VSNLNGAIQSARTQAQALHQSILRTTAKDHAVVRTELQNAAQKAQELSASLKQVADAQAADTKQHLKDAVTALDQTAKSAQNVASSAQGDIKGINRSMLANARTAVQKLSRAVAAQRSSLELTRK
jgi:hypothetical protein